MPARRFSSPLGELTLFEDGGALTALRWDAAGETAATPLLEEAARQLAAYFAGRLERFDLPLAPRGTPHQRRVWAAIAEIAYGETASYGDLATRLASAPRAVGAACRANPLPILLPCHRVLGADGRLIAYSGAGGTATKAWLLRLENPGLGL